MPHLVLDHAADIAQLMDIPVLLKDLSRRLGGIETFDLAAVKARAQSFDIYTVSAKGPEVPFVHLSVNIMEGRTPEIIAQVREAMFSILSAAVTHACSDSPCSVTIEIRDMSKAGYKKN